MPLGIKTMNKRSSGILLHLTSLPSPYGIGDLGPKAYEFVDFLKSTNQTLWQILPIGITGDDGCPYASYSAFGGSPNLISPDLLIKKKFLTEKEVEQVRSEETDRVCYPEVTKKKDELFRKAFERFKNKTPKAYETFLENEAFWVHDLAIFLVLLSKYQMLWTKWPKALKERHPAELDLFKKVHNTEIEYQLFLQFTFFEQWTNLRSYANKNGVKLIGDIPIFVSHNSMEAWSNPHWFKLHTDGSLKVETGAPPDGFSADGQKWGTPNYNWEIMKNDGFHWWIERMSFMNRLFDFTRLDHFRGFAAVWESAPEAPNAIGGQWAKTPGDELFATLKSKMDIKILAEDLGEITPDVIELRDKYGFPGMKILQFAFGGFGDQNIHLPQNHTENCLVYTGTHDNDTTLGWARNAGAEEKEQVMKKLSLNSFDNIVYDLIRAAFESPATIALIPMQDVLCLGSEARFNIPGTVSDKNWTWRLKSDQIESWMIERLIEITSNNQRN